MSCQLSLLEEGSASHHRSCEELPKALEDNLFCLLIHAIVAHCLQVRATFGDFLTQIWCVTQLIILDLQVATTDRFLR